MPKSCSQSIGLFMATDKFYALFNEIYNLLGFSINLNLSLVSISLVDAGVLS